MIELASRYQGKEAHGHGGDLVKVQEGNQVKYKKNFISFNVNNFDVAEKGTLQDIVDTKNGVRVDIFDRDYKEEDNSEDGLL
jgi:hypothetical protein